MSAGGRCRRPAAAALVFALLLAAALGCGKKGPPRPPPSLIPAQTTDLGVRQTGDQLVLELSYPASTTGGLPLTGVDALEVLALRAPPVPAGSAVASVDLDTFAATAKVVKRLEGPALATATSGARLVVTLDAAPGSPLGPQPGDAEAIAAAPAAPATVVEQPPGSQAQPATPAQPAAPAEPAAPPAEPAAPPAEPATEPAQPAAPAVEPGAPAAQPAPPAPPASAPAPPPLLIAVRTFGPRGHESPLSNLVAIVPTTSPPPPATLELTPTEGGVQVTWTPSADAPVPAGFDLLRRRAGEVAFDARVAAVGADRREHLDATAAFGERYQYTVRTVGARGPLVESADGPVREIEYSDTFPPPTPQRLVALAEEGRIRLLWDRVEAPDLAGYRLYRRENDSDEIELERAPGGGNDHADDGVRAGATYTYRVTAVDAAGNQSAPSGPAAATPR